MKRLLSKAFIVGVAAVLFATLGATPASAQAAGTALLTGTTSNDLLADPLATVDSEVHLSGTAVGVIGTGGPATCTIDFDGSIAGENLALGLGGQGSLTCTGTFVLGDPVSVSCDIAFDRVGGAVLVTGGCTGTVSGDLFAECVVGVDATAPKNLTVGCAFEIV